MSNSYFQFKQFRIEQDRCAMKVGTDGVLLGAWSKVDHAEHILDIGTGTGLLTLMLAQKSKAFIDAIDIDLDSFEQANQNILSSPWYRRIKLYHISAQQYTEQSIETYDLIISNPPFFINSSKSSNPSKQLARHDDSLSQDELLQISMKLLNDNGRLSVIYPIIEALQFQKKASLLGLFQTRTLLIYPNEHKDPKRILMEFSKLYSALEEKELFIEQGGRHNYSSEYKNLTKEYYLKF